MERVFEPNCITILPTNVCNARCRHCSMNAGPDRSDTLSWEQLRPIIEQVYDELPHLDVVVFSGGESTLLGDDLLRALRLCKAKRQSVVTRLVTNAHWARTPEDALAYLKTLRAAGLDELNISTDDYHLPWISLQKVRNAYDAALQLDFLSVALSNAYGPESWLSPDRLDAEFGGDAPMKRRFDEDGTNSNTEFRWDKTNVILSNSLLNHLGRGNVGLEREEVDDVGERLYEVAKQLTGCPWALRSAAISAKGHFLSCCGFEVEDSPVLDYGDLATHSLNDLIDQADRDLVTNMIAIIGPPQLKLLLEDICPDEVDFPRKDYASYCEVCEDLTGIEQNRRAMYKYGPLFVDSILELRDEYKATYGDEDGRVNIPAGARLQYNFFVRRPGDDPDATPPEVDPRESMLAAQPDSPPSTPDA